MQDLWPRLCPSLRTAISCDSDFCSWPVHIVQLLHFLYLHILKLVVLLVFQNLDRRIDINHLI